MSTSGAAGHETSTEHLTLGAQDASTQEVRCALVPARLSLASRFARRRGGSMCRSKVRSLADARRLARRGPLSRCQTLTSGFPRSLQKPAANADTQRVEAAEG